MGVGGQMAGFAWDLGEGGRRRQKRKLGREEARLPRLQKSRSSRPCGRVAVWPCGQRGHRAAIPAPKGAASLHLHLLPAPAPAAPVSQPPPPNLALDFILPYTSSEFDAPAFNSCLAQPSCCCHKNYASHKPITRLSHPAQEWR
jgi:hypothetical protein